MKYGLDSIKSTPKERRRWESNSKTLTASLANIEPCDIHW